MKNRYAGDVGDFGKYGLLRHLAGMTSEDDLDSLKLGMVWYLRPDDCGNDGRHTGYLKQTDKNREEYRACDSDLWDELRRLVCVERRR